MILWYWRLGLRIRFRVGNVVNRFVTGIAGTVTATGDSDRTIDFGQVCVARVRTRETGTVLGRTVRSRLVGTYHRDGLEKLPDGRQEEARTRGEVRWRKHLWMFWKNPSGGDHFSKLEFWNRRDIISKITVLLLSSDIFPKRYPGIVLLTVIVTRHGHLSITVNVVEVLL